VGLEEEALHGGAVTGAPGRRPRVPLDVPEPQKNGKTIHWFCTVDVGNHGQRDPGIPQEIVCGATTSIAGDLVVVASCPAAVLPGEFEISARKTYGHGCPTG
jgi:phenylalanyl-tRNA synthetase beta chain